MGKCPCGREVVAFRFIEDGSDRLIFMPLSEPVAPQTGDECASTSSARSPEQSGKRLCAADGSSIERSPRSTSSIREQR